MYRLDHRRKVATLGSDGPPSAGFINRDSSRLRLGSFWRGPLRCNPPTRATVGCYAPEGVSATVTISITMASKGTIKLQPARFGFESNLADFTSRASCKTAVNSAPDVIVTILFSRSRLTSRERDRLCQPRSLSGPLNNLTVRCPSRKRTQKTTTF